MIKDLTKFLRLVAPKLYHEVLLSFRQGVLLLQSDHKAILTPAAPFNHDFSKVGSAKNVLQFLSTPDDPTLILQDIDSSINIHEEHLARSWESLPEALFNLAFRALPFVFKNYTTSTNTHCVCIEPKGDSRFPNSQTRAVACDNTRAIQIFSPEKLVATRTLINDSSLRSIKKIGLKPQTFFRNGSMLKVTFQDSPVLFFDQQAFPETIDTYPSYQHVFSRFGHDGTILEVLRKKFRAYLSRAKPIFTNGLEVRMLETSPDIHELRTYIYDDGQEVPANEEPFPHMWLVRKDPEVTSLHCNRAYLLDVLAAATSNTIRLQVTHSRDPILLWASDILAVIMPMSR